MSSVACRPIPRISSRNFFPTSGSPRTLQRGARPPLERGPRGTRGSARSPSGESAPVYAETARGLILEAAHPRHGRPRPSRAGASSLRHRSWSRRRRMVRDTDRHERRHPHPLGNRAGRPAGGRAPAAACLRPAASPGQAEARSGEAWSDTTVHRVGPRGPSPAVRWQGAPAVEEPGPFLRRPGRGDATNSHRRGT
jgi:hypothetical protein